MRKIIVIASTLVLSLLFGINAGAQEQKAGGNNKPAATQTLKKEIKKDKTVKTANAKTKAAGEKAEAKAHKAESKTKAVEEKANADSPLHCP